MKQIITDYIIIGSGIAGLSCALKASKQGKVAILTKSDLFSGNTFYAQGGVASALDPKDSTELHFKDTIDAGSGTNIQEAVRILVNEGISRVLELKEMGVPFDLKQDGNFALAREGAHSQSRIVSALGDSTGKAILQTLIKEVKENTNITIYEYTTAIKILTKNNECLGCLAVNKKGNLLTFLAKATVLATGGCGQIYTHTTNNKTCTGDGFALAYLAGAKLSDMEFIQFHPTALDFEENPRLLISEAVRGEGAILVNQEGKRFMQHHHTQGELAPRDIVARGIYEELTSEKKVFLDTSFIGRHFSNRFPYITNACRQRGFEPVNGLLPVTPAAHFIMGGVRTDINGKTTVNRLYACGEVAYTGVHGANRLASNSLLEGLVFAHRTAAQLTNCSQLPNDLSEFINTEYKYVHNLQNKFKSNKNPDSIYLRQNLRNIMWEKVGIIRTGKLLTEAIRTLKRLEKQISPYDWETKNMFITAILIAKAAFNRQESRGSHFRRDFPSKSTFNRLHNLNEHKEVMQL